MSRVDWLASETMFEIWKILHSIANCAYVSASSPTNSRRVISFVALLISWLTPLRAAYTYAYPTSMASSQSYFSHSLSVDKNTCYLAPRAHEALRDMSSVSIRWGMYVQAYVLHRD